MRILSIIEKFKKYSSKSLLIDRIDSINIYLKFVHFLAGLDFKRHAMKCKNFEDHYNLITTYKYSLFKRRSNTVKIRIAQIKFEILEFIKELATLKPKVVFEIGTYDGGTLFLLSRYASSDATLISLDLPILRDTSGYSPYRIPFYKSLIYNSQKMFLIRDDSHKSSTLRKVKRILNNKQIDVLFIDGDHSYDGVKKDFKMYSPLVRRGGIIAFHDIIDHPKELKCEVSKFWNEIKEDYDYKEIIKDSNQKWAGIGIIRK